MKYEREGALAVVEFATRPELNVLKLTPAKFNVVGKRFKFTPNDAALQYLHDIGVKSLPNIALKPVIERSTDFEFKTDPFNHQREGFFNTREMPSYALLWEMGLGKTKTILDTAAWLYKQGKIDGILVITLNGVHRNWIVKEIPEHLPEGCNQLCQYWESHKGEKKMRTLYSHAGLAVAAINMDALHTQKGEAFCEAFLKRRTTLVVVDESHGFKNPASKRTKVLLKLAPLAAYKRILTGTPVTNSPSDVYSQFKFLQPNIWEPMKNFYQFRNHFSVLRDLPSNPRVKIEVRPQNVEELQARILPLSSRLTKEQCLDLPPKIYRREQFVMTEEQARMYSELVKRTKTEFEGRKVEPKLAITRLLRLHQIACGFFVPDDIEGSAEDLDKIFNLPPQAIHANPLDNPRIAATLRILEQAQHKAIIWATYRMSLQALVTAIKKQFGENSVVGYSGMTPQDDRQRAVAMFQDPASPVRFFVGQPRAGGTGITLTEAADVLYFSNDYSLNVRLQSEDRAHRIGQARSVTYHDIEAVETVDDRIITSLRNKRDIASQITGDELVTWLTK